VTALPPTVRRGVHSFDAVVDDAFVSLRRHRLANKVLYAASEAGNFSVIWHALAWAPVLVRPSRRRVRRAIEVSAVLGVESLLVNGVVKSLFRRQRPDEPEEERPHRLRAPKTSSFPSGHATAAMVAAAMLSRHRPRRMVFYALGTLVAASRVHVRIHHASDVIGGLAIGLGLGRVARRLLP
jgi:undecaprenyl-diphosphatase